MKDSRLFKEWSKLTKGLNLPELQTSFASHIKYSLSKNAHSATVHDLYRALALTARDRMMERWMRTQEAHYRNDAKRVYYLSAEYLMGRALVNSLINLGIYEETRTMLERLDLNLEEIAEQEPDAGLGNGGLGRLAACFLDSVTALQIPCVGYGIRYEFGIFSQEIRECRQIEHPDAWLKYGNPWEIARPEYSYVVRYYGHTQQSARSDGTYHVEWMDTHDVVGVAYDTPIDGYGNDSVNTLRLWEARASTEFDLEYFQDGDYLKAVEEKSISETISKVLYPNDTNYLGRELRLKQQYFFVSCSLQDIVRRYLSTHDTFDQFPDKVAIQLNDTHPSIAVPELMRLLMDEHQVTWKQAWEITTATFAYTNHTLLSEALEKWRVEMLGKLLPRHLQIIYEINRRFLRSVAAVFPGDTGRLQRMSLIEEGAEQRVRMANLAIVGSHSVNGVSQLHTKLLREHLLRDFNDLSPEKFNAKTNGVTPRRWLLAANPGLAALITEQVGDQWPTRLDDVRGLIRVADDAGFQDRFRAVKQANKLRMAKIVADLTGISVDPQSIFDVQVKRIHEYKRQLMNVVHIVATWLRLKHDPPADFLPRTYLFGGKAAPGYRAAKQIIRLICEVSEMINNDPTTRDRLRVVYLPNYRVSMAERLIPAADVSEQISTAGFEASGTGNMKFAMNGALTIGTLDGANIEIVEEVGADNIFIFGMTAEQVTELRPRYRPRDYYDRDPLLRESLALIRNGFFCPEEPDLFHALVDKLLTEDRFFVLADFAAYMARQDDVNTAYHDRASWTRQAIVNVAGTGRFSSDRTILEYNRDIWHAKPIPVGEA